MARARAREDRAERARILVVDDAPDTLELIQRNLASQGYRVFTATGVADALSLLGSIQLDLVVTDIRMPGQSGMDLIREVRARRPELEIIVITGYATIEGAVEALQQGAWDYLAKPFTAQELLQGVRRVLARRSGMMRQPHPPPLVEFHGLLGRSKVMRSHFDALTVAAKGAGNLLVRGDAGSGREAAARALHFLSGASGPFVRVTMDAPMAPAGSIGGVEHLAGLAAFAAGGTLYLSALDAASDHALEAVSRLVAGERRGTKRRRPARIVASVSAGPGELSHCGPAMSALLRRFAHVVTIPPLRERGEDVVLLARRFLAEAAAASNSQARTLTDTTEHALRAYSWPGNVRELKDLMHQLALSGRTGPIAGSELPACIAGDLGLEDEGSLSLAGAEKEHVARVLRRTAGNKSRAAEILGIDRKTLRDKLRDTRDRSAPKRRGRRGRATPPRSR